MTDPSRQATWQSPVEIDPGRPATASTEMPFTAAVEPGPSAAIRTAALVNLDLWPVQLSAVPVFLGSVAALITFALAFDAADLMERAFATSHALGTLITIVLAVTVGSALKLALDEMVSIRRLRHIDGLRDRAAQLVGADGHGSAMEFADTISAFYGDRTDLAPALQSLQGALSDAHNDREVIALIDRQVLSAIDQRAYSCVLRASRDTAVATALSPSAALDVAIVLWRNLKLVREVSTLYGARPGQFGSWRLMRRMLANLAVAGVAESVSHVAVDALGGTLAAAVSTRLGQGMINGLLTARIGLAAMNLCRPVAYTAENKPTLRRIRSELMSVPKEVL
ncbi:MAG: TIGR01620 family protein [Rhodospirillaceae bacterium]